MYSEIVSLSKTFLKMAKSQKWYHGGPRMTNWSESNWDRDRTESDLNAEGPGIYFTSDQEEAESYMRGSNATLYSAEISGFNSLPQKKPTKTFLLNLFNSASDEHKETFLSNWGLENTENPITGLNHYIHQNTMLDAAVVLYHDLFQYDAHEYIQAMVSMGFDGVIIDKGTTGGSKKRQHLIVWNPKKLYIQEEYG
jgi:hypothetical protein